MHPQAAFALRNKPREIGGVLYKSKSRRLKLGAELPFAKDIDFGGSTSLKTGIAPHAADYNGDGLFDLIIGKANGRIAVAINRGTKTEPEFDAPAELKGTNMCGAEIRPPAIWTYDAGVNRGNLYANLGVTQEKSPGGGRILKAGYSRTPNKVFKTEELTIDGRDAAEYFAYWLDEWVPSRPLGPVRTAQRTPS